MRRSLAMALAVAMTGLAAGAVRAEQATPMPFELVRTLQALQDEIVQGSTAAHVAQRTVLANIEERFLAADPAVWQDPKNARAAVTYLLSGGQPSVMRRLLALKPRPNIDERLMLGALAYVEGREDEAQQQLSDIDPRSLPESLGGHVALVKAALTVRDNPQKAIALLDFARLSMTGTLVEEAALRREIFVAGQIGDMQKFEQLFIEYIYRFRRSIYAGNFRQRFALALTRLDFAKDPQLFPRLEAMLEELDPEGRRDLYLLVAGTAVAKGQRAAAIMAAERALQLSPPDSIAALEARLYRAAALIASEQDFETGLADLKTIDRSRLPSRDIALLDAALAVADGIRHVPGHVTDKAAEAGNEGAAKAQPFVVSATMERAEKTIASVDQLLKGGEEQ